MIYSINEGQQANKYKDAKNKEISINNINYEKRLRRRKNAGNISRENPSADDINRQNLASDIAYRDSRNKADIARRKFLDSDRDRNNPDVKNARHNAQNTIIYDRETQDAINRHIRRHPKQYKEGTIFESVEFI